MNNKPSNMTNSSIPDAASEDTWESHIGTEITGLSFWILWAKQGKKKTKIPNPTFPFQNF